MQRVKVKSWGKADVTSAAIAAYLNQKVQATRYRAPDPQRQRVKDLTACNFEFERFKMEQIKEYHKRNAEMFNKLYPELKDIEIYYSRHDRYNDKGHRSITPIPKEGFLEGKYFRCSDEDCTGKYNLSGYIKTAIENDLKEFEIINNNCGGKLRGSRERYCERATSFWIKLIYK